MVTYPIVEKAVYWWVSNGYETTDCSMIGYYALDIKKGYDYGRDPFFYGFYRGIIIDDKFVFNNLVAAIQTNEESK